MDQLRWTIWTATGKYEFPDGDESWGSAKVLSDNGIMNDAIMNGGLQKCPVCDGTGLLSRPPYVAGDVEIFTSGSSGPWKCEKCDGNGMLILLSHVRAMEDKDEWRMRVLNERGQSTFQ